MRTVASGDGTRIAYWRSGQGPPMLLVHGATADHGTTWPLVLSEFERQCTVYAMDRRGRGASGDAPDYDLLREAEDVAAVVDDIGGSVTVLGHSYGGLCSLEATLLTGAIGRLILYESVPLRGAEVYPPGFVERLEGLLAAGQVEEVLVAMYGELVEMPPEELALMRSQHEAWERRLVNTRALPREMREEQGYAFDPARFAAVRTPTLLLVGGESPAREMRNARGVAAGLPDARVRVLPGQQHAAMHTAPELFARAVVGWLAREGGD